MTDLTLIEVAPGRRFPLAALHKMLDGRPRMVVKFAAVFGLDEYQLGHLLRLTCPDVPIVQALTLEAADHSGSLQDYIIALGYDSLLVAGADVSLDDDAPEEEPEVGLLAEMFEQLQVKIADEISEVADELADALGKMPGKEGRMRTKSLLKLDRRIKRKLGIHEAQIVHGHRPDNLVVFDVSGSMGQRTVERIVEEVRDLTEKAQAHLVIVSDEARYWRPGEFSTPSVLAEAQYGGTHYETLAPLFDQDWGVVITIADYDSSWDAKAAIKAATGKISLLLDISLVERPTFLAECLSQIADETRPLMVARRPLTHAY